MGKAVRIVIPLVVGVVSSIPSGGNFIFADFETIQCQFCTKMPEMSDLCYLGKTRLIAYTKKVSFTKLFYKYSGGHGGERPL